MSVIYKYPIPTLHEFTLELPVGAQILSLQTQRNTPNFWVKVDPEAPKETRRFVVVGTGFNVPAEPHRFLGTYQIDGGSFVGHVFEIQ